MDWLFDSEWDSFEKKYGRALVANWQFDIPIPRTELWPYIADTSRFNRAMQVAPRTESEKNGQLYITDTVLGIQQEWIEDPWSWIVEHRMMNQRRFLRGMFRYIRGGYELQDYQDGAKKGTRVLVTFGCIPSNFIFTLIAKIGYRRLHKQFSELFKKIENAHEKGRSAIQAYAKMTPVSAHLSATAQFKFEEFSKKLKIKKFATSLVDRFIKHIKTAADLDLNKIRIIALAREWQVDENDLLVLAMHATREGLLRLSWELVCPHCRSTRETSERLEDIRKAGHCDVCEVDFSSQDPNAVEINFRVQPSVRVVTEAVFCAAEAAKKDHIKVQLPLKPGESWKGSVHLAPGLYRLRWVGEKNQYVFQLDPKGLKEGTIEWDGSSNFVGHEESYNQVTFEIANSFQQTRLFVLEQMWWAKDLLTPGKVFSLQEFRDLFTEETLGIGTVLDVGEQAILFTDIVGSTEFYETTGDSFAFSAVSKHFDELFKVIREHKGAVIKTVGDAVMGAFNDPSDALKASFAMQNIFVKNQKDLSGIRIRVSAHTGPVLAVRLNSPIDYFGATVNYAAKLQALCGAHEIAFSEKLYETYKALFKDEAVNAEMKSIQISTRKKTIQGYVFNMKA